MNNLLFIELMDCKDLMLLIQTSFSPAVCSENLLFCQFFEALTQIFFPNCSNIICFITDVPEGSFIIRAHTPMSNLFSCLWFNEVDRFTPRDQLSFAYTYQKLRRMNPDKPFHLHMFKVKSILCEYCMLCRR